MKYLLYLVMIFGINKSLKSQDNFFYVDQMVLAIPASTASTTTGLAQFIQMNFTGETEKFRAIYSWVAHNIDYNKDSILHFNTPKEPSWKMTEAMRRRKGVCENFAAIFHDIAAKCNLTSAVVQGYTKQDGKINKVGHSWCAGKVDGDWFFFDPTWDEDFNKETDYFKIEPKYFITSHMPFDPLWQLLPAPVTPKEFVYGNRIGSSRIALNYKDSVSAYLMLDSLLQYESAARRMKEAGQMNQLTDHHYRFLQMQIGIIYENEDMNLYNAAVADLNKANSIFNDFVRYRNERFVPIRSDEELNRLLLPVESLVNTALQRTDEIGHSFPNPQYDPALIRNRLNNLKNRVADQQMFLKNYFATPANNRPSLFYE